MTTVQLRIDGAAHSEGTEEELRSLLRWLRADESLEHGVTARMSGSLSPPTGSMGAAFDVIQLTVESALSAGALAVSVLQWRGGSRRRQAELVLRRGELELRVPAEAAETDGVRRIVEFLGESDLDDDSAAS